MKVVGNTVGMTTNPKKLGDKLGLETKLDKTTEANKLYGTDSKGNQTEYDVSASTVGNAVVRRIASGQIDVPWTPASGGHATSKGYVDTKHNEVKTYADSLNSAMNERVSDLESLTLTFTEDKATAYEKSVPAEVGKPSRIKMIGGATEKVTSKNLIKNTDISVEDYSGEHDPDFTYNADGTITYTTYNVSTYAVIGLANLGFPIGKYYLYVEDGEYNNGYLMNDEEGTIEIQASPHWNNETGEYDESTTRTLKVMLWQDTSATTESYEVVEAPEGTVFEPYHEPYFRNAEVTKVESIGANLIPFPYKYGNIVRDVGHKETIKGVTFEILENSLISAIGTATERAVFNFWQTIMPAGDYYLSGNNNVTALYNYSTIDNNTAFNGSGVVGQKFTHVGGAFGARITVESGVTVNRIYYPNITRNVYVDEFKPYHAEPIDTFTLPVDAIKARVDGFGLGIDSTDYNYIECIDGQWRNWQKCKEIILKGTESWWLQSVNANGIANFGFNISQLATGNKGRCSDRDYDGSLISNATRKGLHIGIDVIYIRDDAIKTVSEWKSHLANRYANGNPIKVIYKLVTSIVTDITDLFTEPNKLQVEGGGSIRFVNEHKIAVPNTVAFVTRKE